MNLRSPRFDLREFSESVEHLDVLQILDAVLAEINAIQTECRSLGFGNLPKKGSKARTYVDDLLILVPLFTNTTAPTFRPGYVREAWPMLKTLSDRLVSLSSLRGQGVAP